MKKVPIYAYYFPNWHIDPQNEKWHGTGWTEWNVVKHATPRFEGHDQPRIPLWGYEDESDPKVMEKKIETAMAHGIDGFIWDYYRFADGNYRERALEEGFFKAKNNEKFKIALMWCNHDPIYAHPATRLRPMDVLKNGDLSYDEFLEGMDYFIKNYFVKPNYMRIDGKIYFVLFNPIKLVNGMGGMEKAKMAFAEVRRRVAAAGLGEIMFGANIRLIEGFNENDKKAFNEFAKSLGIESAIRYNWGGNFPEGFPDVDLNQYTKNGLTTFERDSALCDFAVNPTVCNGWDCSARTVQSDIYEDVGYPFTKIVNGRDPELYEKSLLAVKEFSERDDFKGQFITLSTWNEWTEGDYLEPDTKFGYAFLEKIKKVFG